MLFYNKYANFKYETDREFEAGMALSGDQVKEIRSGKMNIKECNVKFQNGEIWVFNTGLSEDRFKLLLNKFELERIARYLDEKRHHVYALGIFASKRLLKMKIATGIVMKQYAKTEQQKRKDVKIRMSKAFKEKNYDQY